jgi:hypothetical protein
VTWNADPYRSVDEFVERAVQMLHEQEEWFAGNRDGIAALIEHGFAQAERGEPIDGDDGAALLLERRATRQQHD